jgi:hypothetical protein
LRDESEVFVWLADGGFVIPDNAGAGMRNEILSGAVAEPPGETGVALTGGVALPPPPQAARASVKEAAQKIRMFNPSRPSKEDSLSNRDSTCQPAMGKMSVQ